MSETERERFETIYRETYGRVMAYTLRRVSPEAAKDVVADTFLVAWRRLEEVPSPALPWLLGTARRVLANQRRAAGRQESLRARLAIESATSGGDAAVGDPIVLEGLAALQPLDREALLLVAWDGLTSAEAAVAMDVSGVAFRVRLHRARRRLRAELGKRAPTPADRLRRTTIAEEAR